MTPSAKPLTLALECARTAAGCRHTRPADANLLARFVRDRDEDAFAELVRRHGPLVLGVARRHLDDRHAAEDVVQGTFLALARQAGHLRFDTVLPAWLHAVAYRLARTAQTATGRRKEMRLSDESAARDEDPLTQTSGRELVGLIDAELALMPTKYRIPLLLCAMEGLSREEAALRLGWTVGAVKGRLERGRELLRGRLAKRGLTVPAVLAGGLLATPSEALPATLVAAVMRAAVAVPAASGSGWAMIALAVAGMGVSVGAAVWPGSRPDGAARPVLVAADPMPRVDAVGDPLPVHAIARLGTLRFRGSGWVDTLAVVPGGKQLLGFGSATSSVILWDATTGEEIRRFEAPASRPAGKAEDGRSNSVRIESFAVSPDGKTLAAGTTSDSELDCPLLLFDLASSRTLAEWSGHRSNGRSAQPYLAFATPTLLVSAGVDGSVRVWDVPSKREIRRLETPDNTRISALVTSPDGKHVFAAGGNDRASYWTAWEVATGKVVRREEGLHGFLVALALSPDATSLAVCMMVDNSPKQNVFTEVRVYSSPDWKERRCWRVHGGELGRSSVAYSLDGKMIATGGVDGKVRRWNAFTAKEIMPAIEPYTLANNIAFVDADTLATFGYVPTVKFWDSTTGKPKREFTGSEENVTSVAYSPDGRHVAVGGSGGDSTIRIWEAASGKEVGHLQYRMPDVCSLHFSTDGARIISVGYDGVTRDWNWVKGGAPVPSFPDPQPWQHKVSSVPVAFSPDLMSIATGDEDGIVRVWTLASGKPVHTFKGHTFKGQPSSVDALVFTRDGKALLSSSTGDGIRHWNLATGKEVRLIRPDSLGHSNGVSGLTTSPGGRWGYSSSYDGSICVWEVGSGGLARVIKGREPDYNGPFKIALSPNGGRLAADSLNDWKSPAVHLWDLATGQEIAALMGHRAPATQLAFSPDGRRLVSGSADTTALVWDIAGLSPGRQVPDDKALASLWKDLGADDPKVAYGAVCRGTAAGDAAVARLKLDLKPAILIDAKRFAAWVRQLDSNEFAQREKATLALAEFGHAAETALREALEKAQSPEVRQRLKRVLDGQASEQRRLGNAVEVLEQIATPAAREHLKALAGGAARVTLSRAAAEAIKRLELLQAGR